uniref:Uncharacterized protein n=1 Tax=Plectus sambesii TaxID=2011161 RepID=A0A914VJ30_9BILA
MNNWPSNFHQHHAGVIRRASSYGPIIVELDASDLGSVRTADQSTLQRRYLLRHNHYNQSPRSPNRSHAPAARKLYNRRLGARPHVIQSSSSSPPPTPTVRTMIVEEASEVSDSASRVGTQPSQQPQHSRPWRQVNQDISTRMIAMSSDSPPIIPKRDYDDSPRPRGQQSQSATTMVDQSVDDGESSDDGHDQQRIVDEGTGQLVVYQGGRPPHGAFDGSIYAGEPIGYMPCPPGPMWPMPMPMPPPMGMYPPPPQPPPFFHGGMGGMGGMDGVHHPYTADPGILFTPMGPMAMFDASKHRKAHKKAMKRSQSMELRHCPPPPMFMPPPGGPFMPPMGFQEAASMQMMSLVDGPQQMMLLGGPQPMLMPMQPPMVSRMPPAAAKRPVKLKPPKTPKKHGACYLVCCKGHTQVLWIVVGIILVGIVLGLVLGLTLV